MPGVFILKVTAMGALAVSGSIVWESTLVMYEIRSSTTKGSLTYNVYGENS